MSTNDDPTIASGLLVMEKEEFNVSLKDFIELLWDNSFYEDLLIDALLEKDVIISDWENIGEENSSYPEYRRTTSSQHPLPVLSIIAWLNLPLYVTSSKTQTAKYDPKFGVFIITETSSIAGIPYLEVDVVLEWRVYEKIDGKCEVNVGVRFIYNTSTMIQGLLESISIDEIKKLLHIWTDSAKTLIEKNGILSEGSSTVPGDHSVEKKLISILKAVSTTDINSTIAARNLVNSLPTKKDKDSVFNFSPGEAGSEEKPPVTSDAVPPTTFNTWWG
jgi:hypothetical protein